MVSEIHEVKRL